MTPLTCSRAQGKGVIRAKRQASLDDSRVDFLTEARGPARSQSLQPSLADVVEDDFDVSCVKQEFRDSTDISDFCFQSHAAHSPHSSSSSSPFSSMDEQNKNHCFFASDVRR